MKMTKKSTICRISKKLDIELKNHFPDIPRPELFDVMYKTSALRTEAWLKRPNITLNDIFKKNKKK